MDKYWLYLEPYVFVFKNKDKAILYNTINSSCIDVVENSEIFAVLEKMRDVSNGYCVKIDSTFFDSDNNRQFIKILRETYSGDIEVVTLNNKKPFIISPSLLVYNNFLKERRANIPIRSRSIVRNIFEVNIYIGAECGLNCAGCNSYYKQTIHCTDFYCGNLSYGDYKRIFSMINTYKIPTVNILGGDILKYDKIFLLMDFISQLDFKPRIYICDKNIDFDLLKKMMNYNFNIEILFHTPFDWEYINGLLLDNVNFNFIVDDEADLKIIGECDCLKTRPFNVYPVYNGDNIDFFKKYVFLNKNDITRTRIDKKTIYRRSVINDNFFGKLILLPNGDVYSNMNSEKRIGNILQMSFGEIAYKEISEGDYWLRTRDFGVCEDCVYKLLCPSISNYELFLNRENLCQL
ncbi:TIGR04150 pseudo-rSAM protein [Parabacteroides distasonis]|uniref:TIGR04150 pseudo-rSAM protein n=1 Tax=Parabacteroides distasonis TaxID=823 RepID=UPI00189E52FD|nr:TIGR04150 pseudo-rSAM protein [Parabacteroides distasonis]MDB9150910.1 TIGR04150 pseudo-rSAM protein [Parabacteroides distasonis]MDB9155420.1 TIGR04150 pseudo-rSAM protein [Parabacteroides distasonis]MDB9163784.1 TIGR04150 pseudo-rSAM protein [Parabacteroides distasonis]MDB9167974.1 TIGR04150 pseudo-rSAM protein [Parabacteroides distasonis]MDB9195542.1 TIGR04150 pseudo-rSAM protein [Parabacteroides distasonis]